MPQKWEKNWSSVNVYGVDGQMIESPEEAERRADEIIKNTYRTLLTRGMKGCYIYCTDPGLSKYLKKRVERVKHETGNNR